MSTHLSRARDNANMFSMSMMYSGDLLGIVISLDAFDNLIHELRVNGAHPLDISEVRGERRETENMLMSNQIWTSHIVGRS